MEKEILISRERIQARVKELASQITRDYEGKEPVLIGVLTGAVFFFADLAREISLPLKLDFIRVASYGSGKTSSGTIKLTKDIEIPIKGKSAILVEDIVDTGLTLAHVIDLLQERAPESIRSCVLIDKQERRETEVAIDYTGFQVEKGFVVGYGLDYNEKYRGLPDIYVLD